MSLKTVTPLIYDEPMAVPQLTHLVGRDDELNRLIRNFESRPAEGTVTVVDGEPGIGKTALVDAAARAALAAGYAHVQCVGIRNQTSTGFAALGEFLQPLLGGLAGLPPRQRAALSTALGLSPGDPPNRLMIGLGALGLVEEAACRQPLLLVVEDAHWLDRSSLDAIAFVARRLRHLPATMIITLRDDAHLPELRSLSAERIHLEPLRDYAITTIIDRCADSTAHSDHSRILRAARGNPLAALEMAASLERHPTDAVISFRPHLPTASRLENAFLDRVAGLPERSRALLLFAVAGEGMPLPEVMTAALGSGLTTEDMTPLERSGLVASTGTRITIRHPMLASAVYAATPATDLTRAHLQLAEATSDAGRVAWHRAAASAGQDESVAASLEEAARRAQRRGAQAEASTAYAQAARLTPRTPNRGRRLALAAQSAYMAAQMDAAGVLVRDAMELADDPDSIVRVANTRLSLSMVAGMPALETSDFRMLSRRLGGPTGRGYPEQRLSILWCAAINCRGSNLPREQWRTIESDLDEIDSSSPMKTLALATVAEPGRALLLKPALPGLIDRVPQAAHSMIAVAIAAEAIHDSETARTAWHLGVEFGRRAGAPVDEAQCLRGRSTQRLLSGDLTGALADADQAFHTALNGGARHIAGMGAATAALAYVWRGDHQAAHMMLSFLGTTPAGFGGIASVDEYWAAGLLALDEGRPEDAWAHLWRLRWHPIRALWSLADLAEVAVLTGRTDNVADRLHDASVQAAAFASPRLTMIVERAHALVSDGDEAAEHFGASVLAGINASAPLELARTRLLYGQWLRRNRRVDEARDHLALALHDFSEARAMRWAERAAAEVRASGMPVRAAGGTRAHRPALTPQELRIAGLAADGLTNREIADQVYLSHRTVGAALYRVFPKLGITKRAHLRTALEDVIGNNYVRS
ncbi:AAA family ATPase [Micromonospora sp. CA-240977]|uniref:AAA family ATPase n=1 Tax=Micromonospora sp. CA-240977 TaxID=3239957 RepID=UPI003D8EE15F